MLMYFKKILKLSMDNDMTYLKPELPTEKYPGTFGHESQSISTHTASVVYFAF